MNVTINPKTLIGQINAVASKSHAHRLLIASALSQTPGQVTMNTTSVDIETTQQCLQQLKKPFPTLHCKESGSTLRFLLPILMTQKEKVTFLGSGRLPERPVSPLKEELETHGCTFSHEGGAEEIFTVTGKLQSGQFTLPGNVSSQYITGLLFALPLLDGNSTIQLTTALESASYVDLTLQVLKQYNITIEISEDQGRFTYYIPGNQTYDSPHMTAAEGDWSNIAFWIIGGILPPYSAITCSGLNLHSLQGDKAIVSLAHQFGGKVLVREDQVMAMSGNLKGIKIDASGIPDLVPILAVAASVAEGTTHIFNAARLRIKESDRLAAVCDCLTRVGANIEERPDGLLIHGVSRLKGGKVSGYNDHRIVMAMAIASVCCENPVIIEGAEAIEKSYPTFFDDFRSLGGDVHDV